MLSLSTIQEVQTSEPNVFAFYITGEVTREEMEAMADHMNNQFDKFDSVNMLMIFDGPAGSEFAYAPSRRSTNTSSSAPPMPRNG